MLDTLADEGPATWRLTARCRGKDANNNTYSHASKGKAKTLLNTLGDLKASALLNKHSDKLKDAGPRKTPLHTLGDVEAGETF